MTFQEATPPIWAPLPGPQTEALRSEADTVGFGGSAGGGKTDLLLGAAINEHVRSIIFRREGVQLKAMTERAHELLDGHAGYNGTDHQFRFNDGRTITLGGVKDPGDEKKYQGQPHDLKAFDELTHFTETQFRYLCGWNRSARPGQRCRIIATMNPPTDAEGEWVIRYFAPWLDPQYPNPAQPGELRWFTTIDGLDTEVADGVPFMRFNKERRVDELLRPLSRTFFFAKIEDNPYYRDSNYVATLQGLPEPLRSKLLYGSFTAGREDHPWQIIPTAWVQAAQQRWRERVKPASKLSALGVDVARGGKDKTVFSERYDNWFAQQIALPGVQTPDGPTVAAQALQMRGDSGAKVQVDVIGVGASAYDYLKDGIGIAAVPLNGAEGSVDRDRTGQLGFVNKRAEWYWKFREALEPGKGEDLALPPDPELLADLCAPQWKLQSNGIKVESKEDIIKRIGRSPDKGDSIIYAHAQYFGPGMGMFNYYLQLAAEQAQEPAPSASTSSSTRTVAGWPA